MAASLGTAILELAANTARFTSDLGRALGAAEKFKRDADRAFKTIGITIGVGAFAHFIKSSIDAADRMNDLRTRTGLSAQQLLVMEGAAVRSGVELEAVGEVASKLSRRLEEARQGTGDAANAFKAMGISVTDSSGRLKSIDTILREVGAKFATYEAGAGKAALATAGLGKGGDRLIPFVEALKETEERFKRLGIVISEDVLTQADEFNDTVEDLKSVAGALGKTIAASLLPHLINGAQALLEFQKNSNLVKIGADAAIIPIKVLASGFITLYGSIAAASRVLVGQLLAFEKLKQLDPRGAIDELAIAWDEAAATFNTSAGVVAKLWGTYEAGAKKAEEVTKRVRPPAIVDLAKLKQANDALEKLRDTQTKLAVDDAKDVTEKQLALLDRQYQASLITEREYWTERVAIQRAGLDVELNALDDQIRRQQANVDKEKANTKERYDAERELAESLAQRIKLERGVANAGLISSIDALEGVRKYEEQVEQLNIKLLELRGNEEEAARRRLSLENRDLRFKTKDDPQAAALLKNVEKLETAQVAFNSRREEQGAIVERLQIQEERIQNTQRVGAIGELEALKRTSEARQQAARELEVIVQKLEAVALASENPKLILQAEQARAALEKLRAESDLVKDKFDTIFKDALASGMEAFRNELEKSGKAVKALGAFFKSFSDGVVRQIDQIVQKELAAKLASATGLTGGGSGPGGGGFVGWLAGLFGGGAGAGAGIGYGSAGTVAGTAMVATAGGGFVPALASGIDFVPKDGLAYLHRGERVVTADDNRSGASGMPAINITLNGVRDFESFRRSRSQIAVREARELQRARRSG